MVTVADPLLVSLVAVIVALPATTPLTSPPETLMLELLVDQLTVLSVSTFPEASFTVAVS